MTQAIQGPGPGIALCLSGGGYRAMIFHVGVVRLNEAGLLSKLSRVTSVSGGSITAAVLALKWDQLQFNEKGIAQRLDLVVNALRQFAHQKIDAGAVGWGIVLPGSINDRVAKAYADHLFGTATLQNLPDSNTAGNPRFTILATNVQTGVLWRFERKYMGDYHVGLVNNPTVSIAKAVAASSAFPPVLSPADLKVTDAYAPTPGADLQRAPFTTDVVLADGGVYDNLGLEPAVKNCKTVLVSDGGQKMTPEEDPHRDWARHAIRIMEVIDNQVRSLRKRTLMEDFRRGFYTGAFWGIATHVADYGLSALGKPDPLNALNRDPSTLAAIPTRLDDMPDETQERLINWGYAVCDAALRTYWGANLEQEYGVKIAEPQGFLYPRGY